MLKLYSIHIFGRLLLAVLHPSIRKNELLADEVQNLTDEKKMCAVVYLDYDFFIVKITNLFLAHYKVYGRSVGRSSYRPPPPKKKLFGSTRFT